MSKYMAPEGYQNVVPYLVMKDPGKVISFIRQVFDGIETENIKDREGRIMHAEVKVGDSVIMIGASMEDNLPFPGMLYVYVPDTDEVYRKALAAGAESVMEPADQFYGDRNAGVRDSEGNIWWISTRFKDVPPEELQKRAMER